MDQTMRYYLAYGSNLSVAQMLSRCPDAIYVGTAEIKDYRLLFRGSGSGSYLTIEKCKGRTVPVLVWKVSESDERALDLYEGYPSFYEKEELPIEVKSLVDGSPIGTVPAFFYAMTGKRPLGRPSRLYLSICEEGYDRFGFSRKLLRTALRESCEE